MPVNNWQLTPVADIKWVPGLLFQRPDTKTRYKVVAIQDTVQSLGWDYLDTPTGHIKYINPEHLSQPAYLIFVSLTKEESVIQKIKELNLRYANRRANL